MQDILNKYKDDILQTFKEVMEDEGYEVDLEAIDEEEVFDEILCGLTCESGMREALDSIMANGLIGPMKGISEEEE